jgi:hypothetical protein
VDSERGLRTEFRRALDDVLPPAPWLATTVREKLREERLRNSGLMGRWTSAITVRLPRLNPRLAAAVLVVLLVLAAAGVFFVAHRPVSQVVPAGGAPPQAMPSGTRDLKAGTYAFSFPQLDAPGKPFPKALITVPDGWRINGGFALTGHNDKPLELAVTIWDVVDVYADGCHWLGPTIHPGPTAAELAAVLAARPARNASAPRTVSLGGYNGKYLRWSVPADIRFDAATQNFPDCDKSSTGTAFFKSWNDAVGDRYQQGPGQVDLLWILDVEGHRLLIDATYMPAATQQDRVDLINVVDSIEFKR